jgi:hypothetical protein
VQPVEITHPGVLAKDDPRVETAMRVWDALTPVEQREVFRSLYRSSHDTDNLTRFVDSVHRMVRLESTTDLRQRIRAQRDVEPKPADPADVEDLIGRLEQKGRKPQKPTIWEAIRNTMKPRRTV